MKIKIVKEIPQWIIASDVGAYTPHIKTIWIKKGLGTCKFMYVLFHELCHWFIDKFLNNNKNIHNKLDKLEKYLFKIKANKKNEIL